MPIIADKLSARATAALTVTMDGFRLRPYVVFKGCRGTTSRITSSFSRLPRSMAYSVQPNAWVDIVEMERYIDAILVPFMRERSGVRALHLLGSLSAHE